MVKISSSMLILMAIIGIAFSGCSSEEYTTAKLAIQQQDWAKAEEYLYKAMIVEPDNPEIPFSLGQEIFARNSQWDKMNEMFDKALAINPDAQILESRQIVSEAVENVRGHYWAENHNRGLEYYNTFVQSEGEKRQETLEKAISTFEIALTIKTDGAPSYSVLGRCYFETGEKEKAVSYMKRAVELEPENFDVTLSTGQILNNLDDTDGALIYFQKAVELDPGSAKAIRSLAETYHKLDQTEQSIKTFVKAIKSASDRKERGDLYFNLGLLNAQIGDYMAAEDNFLMAYDLNPDDIEALVGMAQTFERAEKWRRAEKFYKELIMIEPDDPVHYHGMFRVLMKQQKPEEAQRYLEKSKRLGY